MKKIPLCAVAVSSLLLLSAGAIAQPRGAYSGYTIGAELGGATLSTPSKNLFTGYSSNSYRKGGFSYGFKAGYDFALTSNFLLGPEIGFHNNGSSEYKGSDGTTSQRFTVRSLDWDFLVNAKYIWGSGWNAFGKLGAARVRQSHSGIVAGGGVSSSVQSNTVTQFRPEVVVGGGYTFSNYLNLDLNYRHIFAKNISNFNDISGDFSNVVSVDALMFEVSYSFG